MKPKIKKLTLLFIVLIGLFSTQKAAIAQDTGAPALRSIAFYSVGGAAAGAILGVAYWALDPLAPGADLRAASLQGMGVGVFGGFAFGLMMLNQQAIFPYREEFPTNEFLGNNTAYYNQKYQFSMGPPRKRVPHITLFNYQLRF